MSLNVSKTSCLPRSSRPMSRPPVNIALPVVIEEPDDPQATADQRFLTVGYQDTGQHRFSPDSISFGFVIRTTDQPQNRKNTLIWCFRRFWVETPPRNRTWTLVGIWVIILFYILFVTWSAEILCRAWSRQSGTIQIHKNSSKHSWNESDQATGPSSLIGPTICDRTKQAKNHIAKYPSISLSVWVTKSGSVNRIITFYWTRMGSFHPLITFGNNLSHQDLEVPVL